MNRQITQYLNQYKEQYSREALEDQLLKAGYKSGEIAEVADFVYGSASEAPLPPEVGQGEEGKIKAILEKAGIGKSKKRKIIKTIFLAIILYLVFWWASELGRDLRDPGIVFLIGSGLQFIFSLPLYIFNLLECSSYYDDDFILLQVIYVCLWLYILIYSYGKLKSNKILDAWMEKMKMNKKFLPPFIVLILTGIFITIFITSTESGYSSSGRMTACFKFSSTLKDCYEFKDYANNGQSQIIYQVSSQGKNYYTRCNDINKIIVKYRCQDGQVVEETEECPLGCSGNSYNAVCLTEKDRCVDSDGNDYYSKGRISIKGNISYDYCSGVYLYEYKCRGDFDYQSERFPCPNGCRDGACVKSNLNDVGPDSDINNNLPLSVNSRCVDSDSGKDYFKAGNVLLTSPDKSKQTNFNDYCLDTNNLREYHCVKEGVSYIDFYCPSGCDNGACIKDLSSPSSSENNQEGACKDSDGGQNHYVAGSVKLTPNSGKEQEHFDFCVNDSRLMEMFCPENSPYNFSSYYFECPNGCEEGACIK